MEYSKSVHARTVADALQGEARTAAFLAGRNAGLAGIGYSTLEVDPASADYAEHRRGWESGSSERAARIAAQEDAQKRARPCAYQPNTACTCGGRGTCLDVA